MKKFSRLIFSMVFIGAGSYLLKQNLEVLRDGIKTTGKVISLETRNNSDGKTTYCPKVQFELPNGRIYDHQLDQCSSPSGYKVGDSISLVYIKYKLKTVRINTSFWLYYFPCIFIVAGAIVSVITIWKWYKI